MEPLETCTRSCGNCEERQECLIDLEESIAASLLSESYFDAEGNETTQDRVTQNGVTA